jgi:putative molybdopterin biosynthesis protein
MPVELRLGGLVTINGHEIALGRTHALLEAIAQERSVRGAADRMRISYRSAWGRVLALEKALGHPVAVKTKGHGSVLTALGASLRDTLGATLDTFRVPLAQEERALEERLAALVGSTPDSIRLALSHDPFLMSMLEDLPNLEVSIVGSREAVERLLAGRADAAGFHAGDLDMARTSPYDALLQDRRFVVRQLFKREQGFMVSPGNPLSIRSVEDLARTRARYVNRQRGSGTRQWFDRLLERACVPSSSIVGYTQEEFTHQAVAAVIASGAADAGMGVRAVAERFNLGFTPVGQEIYHLAARIEMSAKIVSLLGEISTRLENAVGYDPADAFA